MSVQGPAAAAVRRNSPCFQQQPGRRRAALGGDAQCQAGEAPFVVADLRRFAASAGQPALRRLAGQAGSGGRLRPPAARPCRGRRWLSGSPAATDPVAGPRFRSRPWAVGQKVRPAAVSGAWAGRLVCCRRRFCARSCSCGVPSAAQRSSPWLLPAQLLQPGQPQRAQALQLGELPGGLLWQPGGLRLGQGS